MNLAINFKQIANNIAVCDYLGQKARKNKQWTMDWLDEFQRTNVSDELTWVFFKKNPFKWLFVFAIQIFNQIFKPNARARELQIKHLKYFLSLCFW